MRYAPRMASISLAPTGWLYTKAADTSTYVALIQ
jgi:hypothetical protein